MSALRGRRLLLVGNDPEYFLMHRLTLARALASDEVDLHVAIPHSLGDERFSGHPFEIHRVVLERGGLNPFTECRTVAQLAFLSRRLQPELVHHVTIKPVLYGSVVARVLRTPWIVNSITGLGYVFSATSRTARGLKRVLAPTLRYGCSRRNVTMLFENRDDARVFSTLGIGNASQSAILPSSGINPADFSVQREDSRPVTVMCLGRMLWDKGIQEFVDAARIVSEIRRETRFVLVGATDPNPKSIPIAQLRRWHDSGVVEYWGWRSDVATVLASADIMCLPSYREGLPRSLLEGAAAGLAMIATDVPGCRDVVQQGITGLLVPPTNSRALADSILQLIDNPERRVEMGTAARADVCMRFSVDSVIERTKTIYAKALDIVDNADKSVTRKGSGSTR